MADLSPHTARHDDATSNQHRIDVLQKKERNRTHYEPVPAIEVKAGSSVIDGLFNSPIKGISFRMSGSTAIQTDAKKYTRDAIRMSRERARYVRKRMRGGKERRDYGKFKHGAISLVTTLPPWAAGVVGKIGPNERDDLMLRLVEVQARTIKEISGRPVYGGGIHYDTALGHWHVHVPKTDETGNPYPKATFLTAGKWTVGASRVERKFPGLLTQGKIKLLKQNLGRKRQEHLIDVQVAAAIDSALEAWVRDRGLWANYARDCSEYVRTKTREQKKETQKPLVQAALGHHHRSGIWPLAYSAMTLTMWRLIPVELRGPIMLAIRVHQIIKKPTKAITLVPRVMGGPAQPEMKTPTR